MKKAMLIFITSLILISTMPTTGYGIDGSDFDAGNIISDSVFFNSNSMNASQIQNFLESRVPVCDTNGSETISYRYNDSPVRVGEGTDPYVSTDRATYGARYQSYWDILPVGQRNPVSPDSNAPFVCLKDYIQNTPEKIAESGLCGYLPAKSNQSSAQIIDDVAKTCGISQKVLLVLLQKEQALVNDDWPWGRQYTSATGYGCPDPPPGQPLNCNSEYYGFFNQVYKAARGFMWYSLNNGPNYKKNQNNYILYSPVANCGGSTVYIENQATAGLYNYTPYQPNSATLAVGLGVSTSCGAYGNKNFWWYYQQWFGSTQTATAPGCTEATNTSIACVWRLRNISDSSYRYTSSIILRDSLLNGNNYVYEGVAFYGNVTIAPKPWNVRVYRLTTPTQSTFLTTDPVERNALILAGYQDNGTDFYADPSTSTNSGYPVYRLYSSSLGSHVWTNRSSEVQDYISEGYTNEGIAFVGLSTQSQSAATSISEKNVYRFSGLTNDSHFMTTDLYERDQMIKAGYTYEGVASRSSASTTSKPVYRLYNTRSRKHLYTASENEKNTLSASEDWKYEGINQYSSSTPTVNPTFRLYSTSLTNHLWTSDLHEKQVLINAGLFTDEGISWYQPQ